MTTTGDPELDTAGAVLDRARELRRVADRAEAELLILAAEWAALHAVETVPHADPDDPWAERALSVAGPGAPEVAEFCVAEFALVVGKSTDAGRAYLGDALEVRYRLPGVRARLAAGNLPAWRARRIAQATLSLSAQAAAHVDRQVAPVAHRVGVLTLDRLVEEARVRYDPDDAAARAHAAAETRHVTVHLDHTGTDGIVHLDAALDLPDATDLEDAIRAGAAQLADHGSTDTLHVRRAQALGLLARGQLDLSTDHPHPDQRAPGHPARRISLHVHASADPTSPLVRVEETRSFVLIDRLAQWCTDPATQLDVTPVIDLADHISVEAYEVPDRLATQTRLRDLTCVYPHCTRPARRCDNDHTIPYHQGGTTCTCNIAPLCRSHHRLKTHGRWSYTTPNPGTYLWSSPHGHHYLRDHTGTRHITHPHSTDPTDDP